MKMILSYLAAPPHLDFDKRYKDITVHVGGILKMKVNMDGEPAPTVAWFKDDAPLKERSNVTVTARDYLTDVMIKRVALTDGGEYKLVAKNESGSTQALFTVHVLGEWLVVL